MQYWNNIFLSQSRIRCCTLWLWMKIIHKAVSIFLSPVTIKSCSKEIRNKIVFNFEHIKYINTTTLIIWFIEQAYQIFIFKCYLKSLLQTVTVSAILFASLADVCLWIVWLFFITRCGYLGVNLNISLNIWSYFYLI